MSKKTVQLPINHAVNDGGSCSTDLTNTCTVWNVCVLQKPSGVCSHALPTWTKKSVHPCRLNTQADFKLSQTDCAQTCTKVHCRMCCCTWVCTLSKWAPAFHSYCSALDTQQTGHVQILLVPPFLSKKLCKWTTPLMFGFLVWNLDWSALFKLGRNALKLALGCKLPGAGLHSSLHSHGMGKLFSHPAKTNSWCGRHTQFL